MAEFELIGVVGAGNMGAGIAQKIAQEGLNVVLVDVKEEFVRRGLDNIKTTLSEAVERKILSQEQADATLARIRGATDTGELANADVVIEAIFEDEQVKKELFEKLDKTCSPGTILASNTSSFSITELGKPTGRQDRFVGLHYFYHPAKNRLVEVIPGGDTSRETVEKARLFSRITGKTSILVKDAPGFAVNRFFVPWLNESVRLVEDGVANIPTVEEGAKRAFRIGMGPFELMNVTGVPIAYHSAASLGKQLGKFYAPAKLLEKQFKSGEKWDLAGEVDEKKIDAVRDRFYGVVFGVAAQIVQDGIATIEDVDRGAKIGLRWTLGPFELMNRVGIGEARALVEKISAMHKQFKVPEILAEQAGSNKPWEFTFVDTKIEDGIATITINRPEAMNALNETVVAQLAKAFDAANGDETVRAIVFEGAGKAFVAGADIRFFVKNIEKKNFQAIVDFTRKGHDVLRKIEASKKVTIARLDGLALGGGLETALAADYRIATPNATMGFPETGIGIYPGLGGTQRSSRLIGRELAKYLIFTNRIIDGKTAHEMGLASEVLNPGEVDAAIGKLAEKGKPEKKYPAPVVPEKYKALADLFSDANVAKLLSGQPPAGEDAEKIAKTISRKAPVALRFANKIIDEGLKVSLKKGLQMELDHLVEIFSTEDAYEGLSTLGKKRPEYKGK